MRLSKTSGYFSDVKSDFGAKVPSVLFKVAEHNLKCQLGVNSGSASQTTRLLTAYANIDPRVKKLAVVFRYWARVSFSCFQKQKQTILFVTRINTI